MEPGLCRRALVSALPRSLAPRLARRPDPQHHTARQFHDYISTKTAAILRICHPSTAVKYSTTVSISDRSVRSNHAIVIVRCHNSCSSQLLQSPSLPLQGLPSVSFHKRPLPDSLIALSSKEGKRIFQEALLSGGAESYFPLSEQFITQSEPSFCSLTSLAMVLNALNHDPKKTWKGVWRWISEETLQCELPAKCGHTLDKVKAAGMNFGEFEALAKCHEVSISSYRASRLDDIDGQQRGLEKFRDIVASTSHSSSAKAFVVCNFSRPHLGQTGDGHFSPIGAFHKERDLVLVMDVARFKYPPFWVGLKPLWEAMSELDAETGLPRGFFVISTRASALPSATNTCSDARLHDGVPNCL